MKVKLTFISSNGKPIKFSKKNFGILQALIYRLIPADMADFLHDYGYQYIDADNKFKTFKLFTFSWIIGKKVKMDKNYIYFANPIALVISSPLEDFITKLAQHILFTGDIFLGKQKIQCCNIKLIQEEIPPGTKSITVAPLSPICCCQPKDKYKEYLSYKDELFTKIISKNLIHKFQTLSQAIYPENFLSDANIKISFLSTPKFRYSIYTKNNRSYPVKGWYGDLRLEGPTELLAFALDAGLGSQNSRGWGCITLKENERRFRKIEDGVPRCYI